MSKYYCIAEKIRTCKYEDITKPVVPTCIFHKDNEQYIAWFGWEKGCVWELRQHHLAMTAQPTTWCSFGWSVNLRKRTSEQIVSRAIQH